MNRLAEFHGRKKGERYCCFQSGLFNERRTLNVDIE
jgi:hypothetical protein